MGECFFWYRLTRVVPDKIQRAVKWLCVCVCVCVCSLELVNVIFNVGGACFDTYTADFLVCRCLSVEYSMSTLGTAFLPRPSVGQSVGLSVWQVYCGKMASGSGCHLGW